MRWVLFVIHINFDEESKNMMNECWIDFFLSSKLETARLSEKYKISNHFLIDSCFFATVFYKNHYLSEFQWLSIFVFINIVCSLFRNKKNLSEIQSKVNIY